MTRHTFHLSDNEWRFGQVPRRLFTDPDVYDLPAVAEWLSATVPGNVRTDLLALGRISDPFFGEQYKESLWVEEVDWWYRCSIEPPATFSTTSRAFLIFDGIDYLSASFVNGCELARHEGMFSRQIVEITKALQAGPAEVAVRLWGSSALPRRQLTWRQRLWQGLAQKLYPHWAGVYPDRSATLKCQMSFGWDFAPPIRTMGIWDDVHLVISGPVFITEVSSQSSVASSQKSVARSQFLSFIPNAKRSSFSSSPGLRSSVPGHLTHTPAALEVLLTLDADRPRQVAASVRVIPANFAGPELGPFCFSLDLPAGRSAHHLACHLPEVALWQPRDRGYPHLYDAQISLVEPGGEPLDEVSLRTGIRAVDLCDWQFTINGQREFIRGLNWVPADSFPGRLRSEHYARLLEMARESGANLLRVWGGGLREKRAFYDLCDELGLLVWQEFPFACLFLGSYPSNPAFLALVEAECGSIVRQLRHHPALALWCGGNEFSRSRNRLLLETLAAVVQQHDGSHPFIPVSPSFDHNGDAHPWAVWHGQAPFHTYQTETARFLSEFGLQALSHFDTLQAALPDPTAGWETRCADRDKLARYTNLFEQASASHESCLASSVLDNTPDTPRTRAKPHLGTRHASLTANLQSLISSSQRAQSTALQTAIEHMRRRKGQAGGVCLWQFNEPWPAISWAIVDYYNRPKLAYARLRDWYHPILISLNFPVGRRWQVGDTFKAEIWAINDSPQTLAACELQVRLDETVIHNQSFNLSPGSSTCVGRLTHRLAQSPSRMTLNLHHGRKIVARNSYDLSWFDESNISFLARFKRWVVDWALR